MSELWRPTVGGVLDRVGQTDLVALQWIRSESHTRILLKLESQNPTGSMKDRMALAMMRAARTIDLPRDGGSIVEYTGGSTGVSLAFIGAVVKVPVHIVTSDAFSREKLDHMELLGAHLDIIESDGGQMTAELTKAMVARAREVADRPGSVLMDQLRNRAPLDEYRHMADQIWEQTDGVVDAFVQSVGTAGSIRGISERLRELNEEVKIVAVEPEESPVLSGGESGGHGIDGVGAGFVVPLWYDRLADEIEPVSTADAMAMARRLAREEGLFGGTSTGANVVAALRLADRLPAGSTIVTVMCGTGMKYLSNAEFRASGRD